VDGSDFLVLVEFLGVLAWFLGHFLVGVLVGFLNVFLENFLAIFLVFERITGFHADTRVASSRTRSSTANHKCF